MKRINVRPPVRQVGGFSLLEVLVTAAVIAAIAGLLALVGGGAAQTVVLADTQARGWESARMLQQQLVADLDALPGARPRGYERPDYQLSGDSGSWSLAIVQRAGGTAPRVDTREVFYEWSRETGRISRRCSNAALAHRPPPMVTLVEGVTGLSCVPVDAKGRGPGGRSLESTPEAFRITLRFPVTAAPSAVVSETAPQRSIEFLVPLPRRYVE